MAVEIITAVLTAASSYDLTDLTTVKDELAIPPSDTSKDAFLARAITQVSAAIAQYCNRVFAVETIQDQAYLEQDAYPYQVPGGVGALQLTRWPLVNSAVVALTGNTHSSTLVDGLSTTAGLAAGTLVFGDGIPLGDTVASVNSMGGFLTLAAAATATAAGVALNTGLSVTQTLAADVTQSLAAGVDFTIDAARGWLIRLNRFTGVATRWEALPTTVVYQAGYAAIPFDLVDAALRLVTARAAARGRDPLLRSQDQPGLGTQAYWVGGMPGVKGAFPQEIAAILDNYRVPVTA